MKPGDTVLVNGATGTAGRMAVQLARYLGAGKVIVTGRNESELKSLATIGADIAIAFDLGAPSGAKSFEQALIAEFSHGMDVVIDYLWGQSARAIITAVAKGVEDGRPVRFVLVGSASQGAGQEDTIDLPAAALRSSAIQLMGSGLKSVPQAKLLAAIQNVFNAVQPAGLQIATAAIPLSAIEETWDSAPGHPRAVYTIP